MHDYHRASWPTSLPSSPYSSRLIHRPVVSTYFLLHCIIREFDTEKFDWKETGRTNEKYDGVYLLGHPHHLTTPVIDCTGLRAWAPAGFACFLRYQQRLCLYLKSERR